MKLHKKYSGLYVLTIIETIISAKYVTLDVMDIIIRASFLGGLFVLVEYRQTNLAKWLSAGIFVLCCTGVLGLFNKLLKEETEIARATILQSKEPIPKLDLSSCKDSPIYWTCIKELKAAHKESVATITINNLKKDLKIEKLEVQIPFTKLLDVFLYALLAGVFSAAGVYAATNDKPKVEPVQTVEQEKTKKPKELMSRKLIEEVKAYRELNWSKQKIADHFGWDRKTLFDNIERFEQSMNKTELKLVRGKTA